MDLKFFIDTNIFLEIQLGQNRIEECEKFLKMYEGNDHLGYINSFILYSMILIVQFKTKDIEKSKKLIRIINSYKGIKIFQPTLEIVYKTIDIQKKFELDFDDGLVVSSMNYLKIENLVSFDKHFKNIEGINLLSPSEALSLMN